MKKTSSIQSISLLIFISSVLIIPCWILKIIPINSGETFLVLVLMLEAIYLNLINLKFTDKEIIYRAGTPFQVLSGAQRFSYKEVEKVDLQANTYAIHIKGRDEALLVPVMPAIIEKLKANDIDLPSLNGITSFKMKRNSLVKLTFAELLLFYILLYLDTSLTPYQLLAGFYQVVIIMAAIGFLRIGSTKVTYTNEKICVSGLFRLHQKAYLEQITKVEINKSKKAFLLFTFWVNEKKLLRCLTLPQLGLLCVLADQEGAEVIIK